MLDVLQFILSGFLVWLGTLILVTAIGIAAVGVVQAILRNDQ